MTTTPDAVTSEIRALCTRLGCSPDPVYVRVETHHNAQENDCFVDIEKYQKDHGGDRVIGWQIWEWPGVMVEAEFHAIWRSPSGDLLDVSYKADCEKQILFAADPVRTYSGHKLDNVRAAVWDHPTVHEFIRVAEEFQQEVINRYGPDYVGEYVVDGNLAVLWQRLQQLQALIVAARSAA